MCWSGARTQKDVRTLMRGRLGAKECGHGDRVNLAELEAQQLHQLRLHQLRDDGLCVGITSVSERYVGQHRPQTSLQCA